MIGQTPNPYVMWDSHDDAAIGLPRMSAQVLAFTSIAGQQAKVA
jgi:hypothetical protein